MISNKFSSQSDFDLLGDKPILSKDSVYKPCNETALWDLPPFAVMLMDETLIHKGYCDWKAPLNLVYPNLDKCLFQFHKTGKFTGLQAAKTSAGLISSVCGYQFL